MIQTEVFKAFKTLNLLPNSTEREAHIKYKQLALFYHPDKDKNGLENFKKLQNNQEILQEYFRGLGAARSTILDNTNVQRIADEIRNKFKKQTLPVTQTPAIYSNKEQLRKEQLLLRENKSCMLMYGLSLYRDVEEKIIFIKENIEGFRAAIQEKAKPTADAISKYTEDYDRAVLRINELRSSIEQNFQREVEKSNEYVRNFNLRLSENDSPYFASLNPQSCSEYQSNYEKKMSLLDEQLEQITAVYKDNTRLLEEKYKPYQTALTELNAKDLEITHSLINLFSKIENELKDELIHEQEELYDLMNAENQSSVERKNSLLSKHTYWLNQYFDHPTLDNCKDVEELRKKFLQESLKARNHLWAEELEDESKPERSISLFLTLLGSTIAVLAIYTFKKFSKKEDHSKIKAPELNFYTEIPDTEIPDKEQTLEGITLNSCPEIVELKKPQIVVATRNSNSLIQKIGLIAIVLFTLISKSQKNGIARYLAIGTILLLLGIQIKNYLRQRIDLPEKSYQREIKKSDI